MAEAFQLEAEGEARTGNTLYDLVHHTPSPTVTITADTEGEDETVRHTRPDDAADYIASISTGSGEELHPSNLPDPDNFIAENISYTAEADDTLGYEITVTGHPDVGGGPVAMNGEGEEYINGDEGTAYIEGSEISFEAEIPAERVDPQDTEDFRNTVRVLGGL